MKLLFFITLTIVCGWSSTTLIVQDPIKYMHFEKTSIILSVNTNVKAVSVVDAHHNLSGIFDGKTGEALIFNYETDESVLIPSGVTDKTWYASSQCVEDYFRSLTCLTEFFDIGIKKGLRFDPCSVTEKISKKMVEILSNLSLEYSCPCKILATYLQASKLPSDYVKTSLKGISQVIGDVDSPTRGDLKWKVGFTLGMGYFFEHIEGGVSILKDRNIHLDYPKMLNLPTGIDVLIYLLETLSQHFNMGEILGHFLNSEEHVLILIDKLSGEMSSGFDGAIHTLVEIVKFNHGSSSWYNVELQIRKYYNSLLSEGDHECYETKWKNLLNNLAATVSKFNSVNPCFNDLATLLNDIVNDCWVENYFDMTRTSKIIFGMKKENNVEDVVRTVSAFLTL